MVRESRIPRNSDAQRQMFFQRQITTELAFHERQRTTHRRTRAFDFVGGMRRFELHPIHAGHFVVRLQTRYRIVEIAVGGIARVALRHHHKIGVEFVLHVHRRTIARDGLIKRHHFHARCLRFALAFNRLIVDAYARDARVYALAYQPPHRHDAAVPGVAVDDDWKIYALRDPARDLHALGHGGGAHIRHAGVGTHYAAGADKRGFASSLLHYACVRRGRRVQDGEHLAGAVYEFLQTFGFVLVSNSGHSAFLAYSRLQDLVWAWVAAERPAMRPNTDPAIRPELPG